MAAPIKLLAGLFDRPIHTIPMELPIDSGDGGNGGGEGGDGGGASGPAEPITPAPSEPSGGDTGSPTQPSGGDTGSPTQPSGGDTGSPTQPSGGTTGSPISGNPFQPTQPSSPTSGTSCPDGYVQDILGNCVQDTSSAPTSGPTPGPIITSAPPITTPAPSGPIAAPSGTFNPVTFPPRGSFGSTFTNPNAPSAPGTSSSSTSSSSGDGGPETDVFNATVNNAINVTDNGIQAVADSVSSAIANASQNAADIAKTTAQQIGDALDKVVSSITQGVQSALGNIASVITQAAQSVWNVIKEVFTSIGGFLGNLINSIANNLQPILANIAGVLDKITKYVQQINDTLLAPLVNLYNSTIGTIATLTTAIEKDLHEGLSGLIQIPGQIAGALGSIDATLDRTVQQLGTINQTTVKSGIDYAGANLPTPFGAAMAASLTGKPSGGKFTTTFSGNVQLSSESLQQVASEAISGLGSLLKEIVTTISTMFSDTFNQLSTSWDSVESVFVGLLDGLLGLLTTITAAGALAEPLIDAAQQQARILVPTRKLDPATVVQAMRRSFLTADEAVQEIKAAGFDDTRIQVLQDLSVFLADVNIAIDWWYRGIITDGDLTANMDAHGITADDQQALKDGSVRLPSGDDLLRWLNFGIITQDDFTSNMKVLRYDDAQIQAILQTYQQHASTTFRMQLDGLLNASGIGWFNSSSKLPVPDEVQTAAQRYGVSPDLVQQQWLAHWTIPPVAQFVQAYFRGFRTLTELQARLQMENIPQELWADVIQVNQALIPYRSIPTFVKNGFMTQAQAQAELAAHGFDLAHQEIILKAVAPKTAVNGATASTATHALSMANVKELWTLGAITDEQYEELLVEHGYSQAQAQLQVDADKINAGIKQQKQTLADYTAQVEAGQISLDDAVTQLTQQGFTATQITTFQTKVLKAMKVNAKHPSLGDLAKWFKAGYITAAQYADELIAQGWQSPWFDAILADSGINTQPGTTPAPVEA